MALDKKYYIHTGKDGSLEEPGLDTTPSDVRALFADLRTAPKIAVNIHGGLVSKEMALATAEVLLPLYLEAGIRPIFLIWETGLAETVSNLLRDVWNEGLFESLVQKVLRHAAGKIADQYFGGRDARGLPKLPNDARTVGEYQKLRVEEEPFKELEPGPGLGPLTRAEIDRFEDDLKTDRFVGEVEAAALSLQQQPSGAGLRAPAPRAGETDAGRQGGHPRPSRPRR